VNKEAVRELEVEGSGRKKRKQGNMIERDYSPSLDW
jgi:hypothetical protein